MKIACVDVLTMSIQLKCCQTDKVLKYFLANMVNIPLSKRQNTISAFTRKNIVLVNQSIFIIRIILMDQKRKIVIIKAEENELGQYLDKETSIRHYQTRLERFNNSLEYPKYN